MLQEGPKAIRQCREKTTGNTVTLANPEKLAADKHQSCTEKDLSKAKTLCFKRSKVMETSPGLVMNWINRSKTCRIMLMQPQLKKDKWVMQVKIEAITANTTVTVINCDGRIRWPKVFNLKAYPIGRSWIHRIPKSIMTNTTGWRKSRRSSKTSSGRALSYLRGIIGSIL